MNADRAALLIAGCTALALWIATALTPPAPSITVDTVAPAPSATADPLAAADPLAPPDPSAADPTATAHPSLVRHRALRVEHLGHGEHTRPVVAGELVFVFGPATPRADARARLEAAGFTLLHYHPALGAARAAVPQGFTVRDALAHAATTPDLPEAAPNALAWAADAGPHTLTLAELDARLAAAADPTATDAARHRTPRSADPPPDPLDPWAPPTAAEITAAQDAAAYEQSYLVRLARLALDYAHLQDPIVAVVDSGVAYASALLPWGAYLRAAPYETTSVLPGYDFVREHPLALDENQHGTHIASTIVKNARGGLRLLPIKVLDRLAIGTEYDVARGMLLAVDRGADVINLSLTFGRHYIPSPLIAEVLDRCRDADVLIVAAAGNDAAQTIAWPAALRDVIAVSAEHPDHTPFANRGAALDLVDKGGELPTEDKGLEAEAFPLYRPAQPGKIRLVGTSMASASATGTITRVLHDLRAEGLLGDLPQGAHVDFLRHVVTHGAKAQGDGEFDRTWGMGKAEHKKAMELARRLVADGHVAAFAGERLGAAAQTAVFIDATPGQDRRGLALVEVRAPDGRPLAGGRLYGDWDGAARGAAECVTDAWGRCLLASPALAPGAPALLGLTIHRAIAADGCAHDVRPADRYDPARAAALGDTATTLELITPEAALDADALALLDQHDPLTGDPLYCLGLDCPGYTQALGAPGDLFRIGHRRVYLVTRYPGGAPGPDSLLAGRTLAPSYQYRRHGRELQGGGLTLAFDEAIYTQATTALGEDMQLVPDGIRLGSEGPGDPLLWINDLSASAIAEGTGMMISGLTPITFDLRYFGATLFYTVNVGGTGMMISGMSVKFTTTIDFFSYNLASIGTEWATYGSALLDATHSPFAFFDLIDP